jgi:hypothetical protein
MSENQTHHNAQRPSEAVLVGITRDPVLRPVGIIMAVVGAIWALFVGMASEAGTYKQPMYSVALIVLGILIARVGKPAEQI